MTLLRPDTSTDRWSDPGDDPATATGESPALQGAPDVVAAGVLCWRRGRDNALEVLVVHRPANDDWSWPKGKPDRRESLAECAVRETAEEADVQVLLGRPLPPVRYRLPDGQLKEVSYWAARAIGPGRRDEQKKHEVDTTEWVTVDVAAERLTYTGDAGPLAALAAYADGETLATAATLIIRHATARPRDAWARADGERPLVAGGKRQALAMAALLQCWRPEYVLCSPWKRCLQTMSPYAAATGVRIRTKGGLTEDGYRRSAEKARRHTHRLLESAHGGALCTHRPVLEGIMRALREWSAADVVRDLPTDNPYLHPGEILVAHAVHRSGERPKVVAVERHQAR